MELRDFKPFHLKHVKIKRVARKNKPDGAVYLGRLVKISFGRNKICLSCASAEFKGDGTPYYWLGKRGKPRWFKPEDIQSIEEDPIFPSV